MVHSLGRDTILSSSYLLSLISRVVDLSIPRLLPVNSDWVETDIQVDNTSAEDETMGEILVIPERLAVEAML